MIEWFTNNFIKFLFNHASRQITWLLIMLCNFISWLYYFKRLNDFFIFLQLLFQNSSFPNFQDKATAVNVLYLSLAFPCCAIDANSNVLLSILKWFIMQHNDWILFVCNNLRSRLLSILCAVFLHILHMLLYTP